MGELTTAYKQSIKIAIYVPNLSATCQFLIIYLSCSKFYSMMYILWAAICSSSLFIIFKLFERYNIKIFQAIIINYFSCVAMGILVKREVATALFNPQAAWFPYALVLGLLFISGFWLIGYATQKVGVSATSIAGKTSMVLPVLAAFYLYNDSVSFYKIIGLLLALLAIAFASHKKKEHFRVSLFLLIIIPLGVFLNSGSIEIIINYVQKVVINETEHAVFTTALFAAAGLAGITIFSGMLLLGKQKIDLKSWLAGFILGIPNYFSIYYMLRALEFSGLEPSVVFPLANILIVVITTILAVIIFKEQLSTLNITGVFMAILSIVLIML